MVVQIFILKVSTGSTIVMTLFHFTGFVLFEAFNPLTTKFAPKKAVGSHDARWALVLLRTLLFTKKIDFPKIRHKNVQYFKLGRAHKQKPEQQKPEQFSATTE